MIFGRGATEAAVATGAEGVIVIVGIPATAEAVAIAGGTVITCAPALMTVGATAEAVADAAGEITVIFGTGATLEAVAAHAPAPIVTLAVRVGRDAVAAIAEGNNVIFGVAGEVNPSAST